MATTGNPQRRSNRLMKSERYYAYALTFVSNIELNHSRIATRAMPLLETLVAKILENKVCPDDYLCVQSNSCYLLASLTMPQVFILNVFLALRTWIRRKLISRCKRPPESSRLLPTCTSFELSMANRLVYSRDLSGIGTE